MTPYQRIAIYQRLDFDRDVAEKAFPCSTYTACAGIRNPTHKLCAQCPLGEEKHVPQPVTIPSLTQHSGPARTIAMRAERDFCACGRSKHKQGRMCRKCQADLARKPLDA